MIRTTNKRSGNYHSNVVLDERDKYLIIISPNFIRGGLENRIKAIIEIIRKEYKLNVFLFTKANIDNIDKKYIPLFNKIINFSNNEDLLSKLNSLDIDKKNTIIDIHPFNIISLFENEDFCKFIEKTKVFYTLHGLMSVEERKFLKLKHLPKNVKILTVNKDLDKCLKRHFWKKKHPAKDKMITLGNLFLTKNPFKNKEKIEKKEIRNILFILTNPFPHVEQHTKYLIEEILKKIPNINVHLCGNSKLQIDNKNFVNHGFINIDNFLQQEDIDIFFSRGGCCAVDGLIRNIPSVLFYIKDEKYTLDAVNRDNYLDYKDKNFVNFTKQIDLVQTIKDISNNYNFYQCADLVIKYNFVNKVKELYSFESFNILNFLAKKTKQIKTTIFS